MTSFLASWELFTYMLHFRTAGLLPLATEKNKDALFTGPGGNTRDPVFGSKQVSSKAFFFQPGFRDAGKAGCSHF